MKLRSFAFAAMLLVGFAAPSAAQQSERQWFADGPTPTRYELAITPDAEAGTFVGQATITIESDEALPAVSMNALGLTVQRATIDNAVVTAATDEEAQTLTLTPRRALRAGRHTIRINYTGVIQDDAYGLFRVEYDAGGGQMRRALATQFEPADARRLAPMWDQPDRRAVFALTVTAPTDQMAVSNMPVLRTQRASAGLTRTTFADTPSMPSYLLFLAVGDFERITQDVDGVELGIVVRRGETERGRYALQAGAESLRYFTEYFGIRYPLPKLDMIGVPGAGGFGAMENWGAILYFDQYLLLDDARSSEADRQGVFSIVAHEIAHQWFGNLVTMAWWDDLWLNEGFASWMAAKAMEARHPDWQPWLAQLSVSTSPVMGQDARVGTHPIVQNINTIDEINLAFDDITYDKGLSVIRMLEGYVGEDSFRTGVRAYLNAHLYGNAQTEDLWTAVQAASGQPILEIARGFTRQPGVPMLTATGANCARDGSNGTVTLTQRRFALDDVSRTNETWNVPVVARRVGQEPVRTVLPPAGGSIDVGACGAYVINAGQSAYFRTLYDRDNLARLNSDFRSLEAADQLGLLLDYYTFGISGDAPFGDYMNLVAQVPADANPIIVIDTTDSVTSFAGYARGRPSEAAVIAYGRRTLQPFFERAGWEPRAGENSNEAQMRAELIEALGGLGDEAVIAEARRRVEASATDPSALPAGIRDATLAVYAANATPAQYDALVAQARATTDFVELRRLWRRIATATDPALARRTLDTALTDTVTRQLRPQVLAVVTSSHPRLGWDFLVENRSAIEAMLDPLQRLEYPAAIGLVASDPAIADELEQYASNFPEGAMPSVRSAAANIRLKARTIAERMPAVEAWIAQHGARQQRGR